MGKKKVLVILEVSQKQAYIFGSNKLKDNVRHSANIAWITSSGYFESLAPDMFNEQENLVYAGGGHTVLQFADSETATAFVRKVTRQVYEDYPGLELFAKQHPEAAEFAQMPDNQEPTLDDLKFLSEALERKKSLRRASFRQGTLGIEAINVNTNKPVSFGAATDTLPEQENIKDKSMYPEGVHRVREFSKLGKAKENKSFIAVVHIDGNAMGKRVEEMRENLKTSDWDTIRSELRKFSEEVDKDFTAAYKEMNAKVWNWLKYDEKAFRMLELQTKKADGTKGDLNPYLPIRRIISAGDDITFVAEGSIGIECAKIFMKCLANKTNGTDGKEYAACAGVAIVHQKYPFYRAYEMAEMLCSSAKKYIVTNYGEDASAAMCAIDWHVELGELTDSMEDLRQTYLADDGSHMELRPYIVCNNNAKTYKVPECKDYRSFVRTWQNICGTGAYARGKYKVLRDYLTHGVESAENYLKENLLADPMLKGNRKLSKAEISAVVDGNFIYDGAIYTTLLVPHNGPADKQAKITHSLIFDAIELMDMFTVIADGEVQP